MAREDEEDLEESGRDWSTTKQSGWHNTAKNGGPLHPTLGKRTERDNDDDDDDDDDNDDVCMASFVKCEMIWHGNVLFKTDQVSWRFEDVHWWFRF